MSELPERLAVPHARARQLLEEAFQKWKAEFGSDVDIAWIGAVGVVVNILLDDMGEDLAADWIEQLVALYLEGRNLTPLDQVTH